MYIYLCVYGPEPFNAVFFPPFIPLIKVECQGVRFKSAIKIITHKHRSTEMLMGGCRAESGRESTQLKTSAGRLYSTFSGQDATGQETEDTEPVWKADHRFWACWKETNKTQILLPVSYSWFRESLPLSLRDSGWRCCEFWVGLWSELHSSPVMTCFVFSF